MIPLAMTLDSQQIFSDQMVRRTIVETTADQGWADASTMYLTRGTLTVETRPSRFDGSFHVSSLEIAITQGEARLLRGTGTVVEPLPADEQPDQEDPLELPGTAATPDPSANPPADCFQPPCNDVVPVPPDAKPPVGRDPAVGPFDNLPYFQLFDRTTQRWVEFPHLEATDSYLIAQPERYVDESGAVLFRFINRSEGGEFGEEQQYFQLQMRLEGTIG
jgi:hypothetical protein